MRYLSLAEVLTIHRRIVEQSGGAAGVRSIEALEAALAQPRATFAGKDLYPGINEKAAALGLGIILGHPFVDANKRTGHAAMEVFLTLNGWEIDASVDEQERIILQVAEGKMRRETFTEWLTAHLKRL
ncbi:MAG: type II toxin-antitoxin system death-on-curing family toxin [Chloroflexi bacterium]|nr:type II toxin-antitoxin system death-on-curing family toxin [Chloroflexota bacterium]